MQPVHLVFVSILAFEFQMRYSDHLSFYYFRTFLNVDSYVYLININQFNSNAKNVNHLTILIILSKDRQIYRKRERENERKRDANVLSNVNTIVKQRFKNMYVVNMSVNNEEVLTSTLEPLLDIQIFKQMI